MSEVVTGAVNIAKAVGLKPKQVYNLHGYGKAPIRSVRGLGLVADPVELRAWLLGKHHQENI